MTPQPSPFSPPTKEVSRKIGFGYNHNFRHLDLTFHVQTEDSGSPEHYVHTHIFHAGTVVAYRRIEYGQLAGQTQREVRSLMRRSHRQMCVELSEGMYDARIEELGLRAGRADVIVASDAIAMAERVPEEVLTCDDLGSPSPANQGHADLSGAQDTLSRLQAGVRGFVAAAVVDRLRGIGVHSGTAALDMHRAASEVAAFMSVTARSVEALTGSDALDDVLVTMTRWFWILKPLDGGRFIHLVVDREQGNLAMARRHVCHIAAADCR
ncbi:MAG: hypothetical protein ACE37F_26025 [Nannocystaceae bacterium]|nr:hypothetical protein [bacterium]